MIIGFDFLCVVCGWVRVVVVGGAGNSSVRECGEADVEVRGVSGKDECCAIMGLRSRERRLLLLLLVPELRKERPKRRDAKLGRVGGEVEDGGVM